jgi:hypothetical protein
MTVGSLRHDGRSTDTLHQQRKHAARGRGGGSGGETNAEAAMAAELERNKLKQYVGLANRCVGALMLERDEADAYLRGVVGMKAGHVHKCAPPASRPYS